MTQARARVAGLLVEKMEVKQTLDVEQLTDIELRDMVIDTFIKHAGQLNLDPETCTFMDFIEADSASVTERLADPHEVYRGNRAVAPPPVARVSRMATIEQDRARAQGAQRSRLERHGPGWCSAESDRAAAMAFSPSHPIWKRAERQAQGPHLLRAAAMGSDAVICSGLDLSNPKPDHTDSHYDSQNGEDGVSERVGDCVVYQGHYSSLA
jgi:hypothetical protein